MSDFVGDRQCVTHHACDCIMARAKAAEQLEVERDALREALKVISETYTLNQGPATDANHLRSLARAALAASVSKEEPSEPRKDARITVGLSRIGPHGPRRVPDIGDDRQLEAVNAAYAVMCDETDLPDDFDAAQSMAMAAINAFRSVSKEESRDDA
jgi:hypothetical protein